METTNENTLIDLEKAKALLEDGVEQASALLKNNEQINNVITMAQDKVKELPVLDFMAEDLPVMISMVKSYASKEYTNVSPKVAALMVSALLYLLKRKDLITDAIPILGQLDDVAVIAVALKLCEPELKEYLNWKTARTAE